MQQLWAGFEKAATSVVGSLPGLTSGLRARLQGGVLKAPKPPKPGQSIGPRQTPLPVPSPRPIAPKHAMLPTAPAKLPAPQIPKPMTQTGRGVSSTAI